MAIVLDGTNGISTPDLESAGPVTGTTGTFSGNVTLGTSVLATPSGSAPSYLCRAWVNFNGTGTVAIRASGNVSSITDGGVGQYTVNFTTAMPDVNYVVTAGGGLNLVYTNSTASTTTTALIASGYPSSLAGGVTLADASSMYVAIFR